jgi:hypothetical protein
LKERSKELLLMVTGIYNFTRLVVNPATEKCVLLRLRSILGAVEGRYGPSTAAIEDLVF